MNGLIFAFLTVLFCTGFSYSEEFDISFAARREAEWLRKLDDLFRRGGRLSADISAIPILNNFERKNLVFAAVKGGPGRIAKAQQEAKKAGNNPKKWTDVKKFLGKAGARNSKAKEIVDFVDNVRRDERKFSE